MSAALTTMRTLAPELDDPVVTDSDAEDVIAVVSGTVNAVGFGGRTTEAIARLAAHMLTLQQRALNGTAGATGAGPVTSLRAGDLAVSYASLTSAIRNNTDAYFHQTHHGLAYLAIRDSRHTFGFMVLT